MADPATNSRFKEISSGTYSELYSLQTQLFYNPVTGQARVIFNGSPFLTIGTENKLVPINADNDMLHVDLSMRMGELLGTPVIDPISQQPTPILDPVTQQSLENVSLAGIMVLIKIGYDKWHNERAAAIAQAQAEAEAAAAAAATPPP